MAVSMSPEAGADRVTGGRSGSPAGILADADDWGAGKQTTNELSADEDHDRSGASECDPKIAGTPGAMQHCSRPVDRHRDG